MKGTQLSDRVQRPQMDPAGCEGLYAEAGGRNIDIEHFSREMGP